MIFKLKKGTHLQRDKVYKKGDRVESLRDLVAIFSKEKFERDYEAEQRAGIDAVAVDSKPAIPPPVDKGADKIEKSPPLPEPKFESVHGKNVTSEFPTAEEIEVEVFEKLKWYTIVDLADGEILNKKKLRRKDVQSFLEQYLDEKEDGEEDED